MTDTPLRHVLLAAKDAIPDGPGADHLKAEFANKTRQRYYRAVSRFQWGVLAFFTVLAVDGWRQGPDWRVAASLLLLALLAIFGPGIAVRRLAKVPLRKQVRLAGQFEACVLMLMALVPIVALGLLKNTAAIEMPSVGWLIAICLVTVPSMALLFHWFARALARRFDPEWWE